MTDITIDLRGFEELEKDICAFVQKMRHMRKLRYKSPFITGKLKHPEILFLSTSPIGGPKKVIKCDKFEEKPLEFSGKIEEKLLALFTDIFGEEIIKNSCKAHMTSFLTAQDDEELDRLLKRLDDESRSEHNQLSKRMLEMAIDLKPKKIIIIGAKNFDSFCRAKILTGGKISILA